MGRARGEDWVDEVRRAARAQEGGRWEVIQTHLSIVLVGPRHVYKIKKPVAFEFVDFRSLEARKRACRKEVELNRRWAPDVYLGVVPICRDSQRSLRLGGPGEVEEWAVKMRRLDDAHRLDRLLVEGRFDRPLRKRLIAHLMDRYDALPPVSMRPAVYVERVARHVRANGDDLERLVPLEWKNAMRAAQQRQRLWLALESDILHRRVLDGRIVDGHGDLRPEHIYIEPSGTPLVIDCLEFSDELRQVDVADDLGFLLLETEMLGDASFGERLREAYRSRAQDPVPDALWHFYLAYRASVRAKVVALAPEPPDAAHRLDVPAYVDAARRWGEALLPGVMIVLRGVAGSGKSTLGRALADAWGLVLLSTDRIRRAWLGPEEEVCGWNEGRYGPEARGRVYDQLFFQAEAALRDGLSVVLDGTFLSREQCQRAADLAGREDIVLLVVECVTDEATRRDRLEARARHGDPQGASSAGTEVARRQQALFEPLDPALPAVRVDTASTRTGDAVGSIATALRGLMHARPRP